MVGALGMSLSLWIPSVYFLDIVILQFKLQVIIFPFIKPKTLKPLGTKCLFLSPMSCNSR